MKKILYSVVVISLIISLATLIIAYGRGYRLNPLEKSINSTGILSASSNPDAASVWIDNKLKSATNGSISLEPGWYNLRISKEGYQQWEKRIRIQGEVVNRIDALLIANNPSLRALTVTGVSSPSLSPSGGRVAYILPKEEATTGASVKPKVGVWLFELRNGPLGGIGDPKAIYQPLEKIDWPNTRILWSPDEKNIILVTQAKVGKVDKTILVVEISLDSPNSPAINVTSTFDDILSQWKEEKDQKLSVSLAPLPMELSSFLKNNTSDIEFSADNSKILYLATASATLSVVLSPPVIGTNSTDEARIIDPRQYYVYDLKEDKNFKIADQKSLKDASKPFWYTDSKRIIMIENISITIIDYDGTNKRTIYSGPFEDNIVYPWSSQGKLVILTNLNKPKALPDLYEVDIR
ncbi:PEGA domain-containing protein [Candidatus Gottesmanbacteria bacterium]|nr:PEGA domain-containing protein [Candidatus Gottesmanbacteria bacterium]